VNPLLLSWCRCLLILCSFVRLFEFAHFARSVLFQMMFYPLSLPFIPSFVVFIAVFNVFQYRPYMNLCVMSSPVPRSHFDIVFLYIFFKSRFLQNTLCLPAATLPFYVPYSCHFIRSIFADLLRQPPYCLSLIMKRGRACDL